MNHHETNNHLKGLPEQTVCFIRKRILGILLMTVMLLTFKPATAFAEELIDISVVTPYETIVLSTDPANYIIHLKKQIRDETGIDPEEQQLFFEGTLLDDYDMLKDHGVENNDTLTLGYAYRLWVSGVQVSENNYDDVLGDSSVVFDPESNILTLTDAGLSMTGSANGFDNSDAYGIKSKLDNLTVNLVGANSIGRETAPGSNFSDYSVDTGIRSYGDIAFTGDEGSSLTIYDYSVGIYGENVTFGKDFCGKLTVYDEGGDMPMPPCAINAGEKVEIVSGVFDLVSFCSNGIAAKNVSVYGGVINAKGAENAIFADDDLMISSAMEIINGQYSGGNKVLNPAASDQNNGFVTLKGTYIVTGYDGEPVPEGSDTYEDKEDGIHIYSGDIIFSGETNKKVFIEGPDQAATFTDFVIRNSVYANDLSENVIIYMDGATIEGNVAATGNGTDDLYLCISIENGNEIKGDVVSEGSVTVYGWPGAVLDVRSAEASTMLYLKGLRLENMKEVYDLESTLTATPEDPSKPVRFAVKKEALFPDDEEFIINGGKPFAYGEDYNIAPPVVSDENGTPFDPQPKLTVVYYRLIINDEDEWDFEIEALDGKPTTEGTYLITFYMPDSDPYYTGSRFYQYEIAGKQTDPDVPETGDTDNIMLWLMLLALSSTGICASTKCHKILRTEGRE